MRVIWLSVPLVPPTRTKLRVAPAGRATSEEKETKLLTVAVLLVDFTVLSPTPKVSAPMASVVPVAVWPRKSSVAPERLSALPPMRLPVEVPELSNNSVAPGVTAMLAMPATVPAVSSLRVPAFTVKIPVSGLAFWMVSVPAPILVCVAAPAEMAVVLMVMLPAPAKVRALPAGAMPPLMFSVPLVEPMVAALPRVIRPVRSLVPLKFSMAPPLLMPLLLIVNSSAVGTPLICTAAPMLLATVVATLLPSAPALETRMAPALTVIAPV